MVYKMRNAIRKMETALYKYSGLILLLATFASVFGGVAFSQDLTGFAATLCSLVNTIQDAVFIVALALLTLGGALYAIAHILPGQTKGALQGYGMGMIIGGVVGVILVALAPFVVTTLVGQAATSTQPLTCTTMFGTITT